MIKKLGLLCLSAIAIILELLPFGAVLNFANPEGEPWRRTYSYFSLVPYGYANFAPFIVALLTSALFILVIVSIILKRSFITPLLCVSLPATVISLVPLLAGINNFSIVGALISFVLLSFTVVCFIIHKDTKNNS